MPAEPPQAGPPAYPSEADIDAALAEFDGDARATIRALLHDLATLADDRQESVSVGYVRGRRFQVIGRP
jgi:hypothetical protein